MKGWEAAAASVITFKDSEWKTAPEIRAASPFGGSDHAELRWGKQRALA